MAPLDHELSTSEARALAVVPKIPCLLSALGSAYIILDVVFHRKRKTFHSLMLGMSISDLLASSAWFFTTWPSPSGTFYGAVGNIQTCEAQGFFTQLSLATPLYNGALAVYYVLAVRYGWSEDRLWGKAFLLHGVPVLLAIATSATAIPLNLYNNYFWECWISKYPIDCKETWQYSYTTCERGDNASIFVWAFFYIPLWVAVIIATACMFLVYHFVFQIERRDQRWEQVVVSSSSIRIRPGSPNDTRGSRETQTLRRCRRSQQVAVQGICYIGAFYFTWICPTISKLLQTVGNTSNFSLTVMTGLLLPLQGFLNMLVYIRPRYLRAQGTKWERLRQAIWARPQQDAISRGLAAWRSKSIVSVVPVAALSRNKSSSHAPEQNNSTHPEELVVENNEPTQEESSESCSPSLHPNSSSSLAEEGGKEKDALEV